MRLKERIRQRIKDIAPFASAQLARMVSEPSDPAQRQAVLAWLQELAETDHDLNALCINLEVLSRLAEQQANDA
jgi:hypothetical protein